jgi:ribosome-binding factor A
MKVLPEIEFVRERTAEEALELEKLIKKTREEDGESDR